MKPIFADTSYFIALLSETDERHDAAVEWSETLLGQQVVTEYVLVELFGKRPDKEWSLVDCISFVVMKQRRLTDALTTDHHFEQAGFKVLLK